VYNVYKKCNNLVSLFIFLATDVYSSLLSSRVFVSFFKKCAFKYRSLKKNIVNYTASYNWSCTSQDFV